MLLDRCPVLGPSLRNAACTTYPLGSNISVATRATTFETRGRCCIAGATRHTSYRGVRRPSSCARTLGAEREGGSSNAVTRGSIASDACSSAGRRRPTTIKPSTPLRLRHHHIESSWGSGIGSKSRSGSSRWAASADGWEVQAAFSGESPIARHLYFGPTSPRSGRAPPTGKVLAVPSEVAHPGTRPASRRTSQRPGPSRRAELTRTCMHLHRAVASGRGMRSSYPATE